MTYNCIAELMRGTLSNSTTNQPSAAKSLATIAP